MRAVHAPTPQVLENSIYIFNMVALDAFYVGHDGHLCVLTRSRLLKGHTAAHTESSNEVRPCVPLRADDAAALLVQSLFILSFFWLNALSVPYTPPRT